MSNIYVYLIDVDQQMQRFAGLDFPYVKQAGQIWKLYGPYANEDDLTRKFISENKATDFSRLPYAKQVAGATIVLRHWWAPLIKGALDNPQENTTWYAATRVWSDYAGEKEFWIGMNDLSRSPATDSPKPGIWNDTGGEIFVNGRRIPPPDWKHGNYPGNADLPLTDKGYSYRKPVKITLEKGWNQVLVKAPIGSFQGKNWQNPVKWMFTFAPLSQGK